MEPKDLIKSATSYFLAAMKCEEAGCAAEDCVLVLSKKVATGALATVPTVGPLLSGLVSLYWPSAHKGPSAWDKVQASAHLLQPKNTPRRPKPPAPAPRLARRVWRQHTPVPSASFVPQGRVRDELAIGITQVRLDWLGDELRAVGELTREYVGITDCSSAKSQKAETLLSSLVFVKDHVRHVATRGCAGGRGAPLATRRHAPTTTPRGRRLTHTHTRLPALRPSLCASRAPH